MNKISNSICWQQQFIVLKTENQFNLAENNWPTEASNISSTLSIN
jgi:hypothetical protein